MKTESCNRKH